MVFSKTILLLGLACLATLIGGVAFAQPATDCPPPAAGEPRPWLNKSYSAQCRAKYVLDSFHSLDEKLTAVGGGGRGARWLADRHLPSLTGSDGPAGVRGGGIAVTALPTPLSMAASFDPVTASLYGTTLGKEFFDFGMNRVTGPAMDVARTWHFGRTTESLGEDPFLIASMVGPEVRAIQDQHVVATAKHFAVYNQEQGRAGDQPLRDKPAVNAVVSERAIREIYLAGFEAAVKIGGAGNIMCAFPRVNGVYACENPMLLGILKNEWGFDGSVGPDFPDAQRSIVAAVNAGLDSGIMTSTPASAAAPGQQTDNDFNGEDLKTGVVQGKISAARIDDMILRQLVPEFRTGAFDNPAKRIGEDVSTPERRAITADIVTRGSVLLKNDKAILPFGPKVKSVALIGTQAGADPVTTELGSAHVDANHLAPVLPAMRERAGKAVSISYAPGTLGLGSLALIPTSMVRSGAGEAGFKADYVANPNLDFSAKTFISRQEGAVNFSAIPKTGFPADHAWSVRWTGLFTPVEGGIQHFTLFGSGTARLFIDGKLMGHYANDDFGDTIFANVAMTAGKPVEVRVEWTPRITLGESEMDRFGTVLGPVVRLGWSGPNDRIARAVDIARKADVAVIFVGHEVGEGMDRQSLDLPNDQNALIEAVAAVNPRTVVVLQTGGAVTMPWLNKVAAALEMWLPGDSFGPAAAKLLFGDAEPAGRLPVTFPRDETQGPGTEQSQYPGTLDAKGAISDAHFDEGLAVGYRYWDLHNQAPLFPFGYGLSYTSFKIASHGVHATPDGGAVIDVSVRNTGNRTGSEVVQVYVGFPQSAGEPPQQLKGFAKVSLKPGEARDLPIALSPAAFSYWSESRKHWVTDAGIYKVMVGRSSRDIVSSSNLEVTAR